MGLTRGVTETIPPRILRTSGWGTFRKLLYVYMFSDTVLALYHRLCSSSNPRFQLMQAPAWGFGLLSVFVLVPLWLFLC